MKRAARTAAHQHASNHPNPPAEVLVAAANGRWDLDGSGHGGDKRQGRDGPKPALWAALLSRWVEAGCAGLCWLVLACGCVG